MPATSSVSARAVSLNRDAFVADLRRLASQLVTANPNVARVLLFGSLATDSFSSQSDADLLVVVDRDERRRMDRATEFILHFLPAGGPADVLVYTGAELEREKDEPFLRHVLGRAVPLAERDGCDRR